MDVERLASVLKEALARDGEVDPAPILEAWPEDDVPESLVDLAEVDGIEFRSLASFVWDSDMMSSYFGIRALRLGSTWFICSESDDFEPMVLDRLEVLDAATTTGAVESICGAHQYVSYAMPDEIEIDDMVDRARIVACFDGVEEV